MNINKIAKQTLVFILVIGGAMSLGIDAFAADTTTGGAGGDILKDLLTAINGNLGTTAGLVVSLVGLYMWIWNQVSWGIVVALGGALLTAFPGIYKSMGKFGTAAFSNAGVGTITETGITD